MSTCSVFIAASLDGYIAREDGGIDWLLAANAAVPPGEDCGYAAFMSGMDALVMGRHTFELVLGFETWPYGGKPVVVLSRSLAALPGKAPPGVILEAGEPAQLVERLAARGWHRLYIDGGITIQNFLAAGLIDEITLTTIPILLGRGRPLFGKLGRDVQLELLSSKAFEFGFVQNKYRVR